MESTRTNIGLHRLFVSINFILFYFIIKNLLEPKNQYSLKASYRAPTFREQTTIKVIAPTNQHINIVLLAQQQWKICFYHADTLFVDAGSFVK